MESTGVARFSRLALTLAGFTVLTVAIAVVTPARFFGQAEYEVASLVVHGPYAVSASRLAHLPGGDIGVHLPEDAESPSYESTTDVELDLDAPILLAPPSATGTPFDVPDLQQYDAQIAASNGYLIIATGQNMVFYGKDGKPLESKEPGGDVLGVITTAQLFDDEEMQADIAASLNLPREYASLDAPTYIDLRVRFDEYRKRFWIISELNNKGAYKTVIADGDRFAFYARRNKIVAAVSRTQDPRDGFYLYWWEGSVDDGACNYVPEGTSAYTCPGSVFQPGDSSDFPYLGFSPLYAMQTIHVNNTWPRVMDEEAGAVERYALVNLIAADRMADGLRSWGWTYWNIKDKDGKTVTGALAPAGGHGDADDGTYLGKPIAGAADTQGHNLFYTYWIASPGSPPVLTRGVVPMTGTMGSGVGPQPGVVDLVPLGSSYFTAFRNGGIYSAWTEPIPLTSPDYNGADLPWTRVRFVRVNPLTAQVDVDKTIDVFNAHQKTLTAKGFPEIDVNESGDVVVAYIGSSSTLFPGVHYSVYYAQGDVLTGSRVLRDGEGVIPRLKSDGSVRDDVDHGGVALDPYDDTSIWIAHFYATGTGKWGVAAGRVFGETRADLFAKQLVLDAGLIVPGGAFSVGIDIRNQGDGLSLPCRATIHLSTDDVISSDDPLLGEFEVPAVDSGGLKTVHRVLELPETLPDGGYYVGVLLDRDDRLTEYVEDNNASINNPRLLVARSR